MTPTVLFVGVLTSGSRIFSLFPRWMEQAGIDARIEGVDVPIGAPAATYRDLVQRIASDRAVAGAVITAHKLGVYAAAHDLFELTDAFVPLAREVSVIARRGGGLRAHAPDALAAHATMEAMLGARYWSRHAAGVLCLGAGGAATAIALALLADLSSIAGGLRPARLIPRRLLFVDVDPSRLAALRQVIEVVNPAAAVDYLCHTRAEDNDALLRTLPPASLVINATGLGKDRPGSPLTDGAAFPAHAVVWDLNYRGALPFLAQAQEQREERGLCVHDGWHYFLQGWTQSLSAVLHTDLSAAVPEERAQPT